MQNGTATAPATAAQGPLSTQQRELYQRAMAAQREHSPSAAESPAEARPRAQGWLEKKAEWRLVWERRFVQLDRQRLAYRITADGPEKKSGTVASLSKDPKELTFTTWMAEGGEQWCFKAPNREVYDAWVRRLEAVLSQDENNPVAYVGSGFIELTALADKLAAWKSFWKRRLLELRNGVALSYRKITVSSADRNMYIIASVDRYRYRDNVPGVSATATNAAPATSSASAAVAPQPTSSSPGGDGSAVADRLMLFVSTGGDFFWIKFDSAAECETWYRHVHAALRTRSPWEWLPVPRVAQSPPLIDVVPTVSTSRLATLWERTKAPLQMAAELSPLGVPPTHFHAAALWTDDSGDTVVTVFGGSKTWCRLQLSAALKNTVPLALREDVDNTLSCFSLQGQHLACILPLEPYEERANVRVRPPGCYGGTLTPLSRPRQSGSGGGAAVTAPPSTSTATLASTATMEQQLLIGGATPGSGGSEGTELWAAVLPASSDSASSVVPAPFWMHQIVPEERLPRTAFHAAARSDVELPDHHAVVVCGGCLVEQSNGITARTAAVLWPKVPYASGVSKDGKPRVAARVVDFPPLPQPRVFHAAVTLSNGSIVVVGGHGPGQTPLRDQMLVLPAGAQQELLCAAAVTASAAHNETGYERLPDSPGEASTPVNTVVGALALASSSEAETDASGDGGRARGQGGWRGVECDPPAFPAMPGTALSNPFYASNGAETVIAVSQVDEDTRSRTRMLVLHFDTSGDDVLRCRWRQVTHWVGSAPLRTVGVTLHVAHDYLYVFGAVKNDPELVTPFPLSDPIRLLLDL